MHGRISCFREGRAKWLSRHAIRVSCAYFWRMSELGSAFLRSLGQGAAIFYACSFKLSIFKKLRPLKNSCIIREMAYEGIFFKRVGECAVIQCNSLSATAGEPRLEYASG